MLGRLNVQHELADGPFQPRQPALQHRETRPRHLRRRLEVQQTQRLTQIGVILGRPALPGHAPGLADQHIARLVLAVRHILRRQALLRRQQVAQRLADPGLLGLRRRDLALQALDLALQPFGLDEVLPAHRRPDQLGALIALRQRRLPRRLRRPQRRIQRQDLVDQRLRPLDPTRRPAAHEGGGIVSNGADVVHGRSVCVGIKECSNRLPLPMGEGLSARRRSRRPCAQGCGSNARGRLRRSTHPTHIRPSATFSQWEKDPHSPPLPCLLAPAHGANSTLRPNLTQPRALMPKPPRGRSLTILIHRSARLRTQHPDPTGYIFCTARTQF